MLGLSLIPEDCAAPLLGSRVEGTRLGMHLVPQGICHDESCQDRQAAHGEIKYDLCLAHLA